MAEKRRLNFSQQELNALQAQVTATSDIIFAERNEPEVNMRKKRAWDVVADKVSAFAFL